MWISSNYFRFIIQNQLKYDKNLIENDINFLINTKKFKSEEKQKIC